MHSLLTLIKCQQNSRLFTKQISPNDRATREKDTNLLTKLTGKRHRRPLFNDASQWSSVHTWLPCFRVVVTSRVVLSACLRVEVVFSVLFHDSFSLDQCNRSRAEVHNGKTMSYLNIETKAKNSDSEKLYADHQLEAVDNPPQHLRVLWETFVNDHLFNKDYTLQSSTIQRIWHLSPRI